MFLRGRVHDSGQLGSSFGICVYIVKCVVGLRDEDNRRLTHGKWFLPSYIPLSDLQELLDLSKTITGGNNSFNAPQIWTLILGVLLGKNACYEQQYVDVTCI